MTAFIQSATVRKSALLLFFLLGITSHFLVQGQNQLNLGNLSGSFQTDVQYYTENELLSTPDVDENLLSNSYLQLNYQRGKISAGLRFEAYLNPLLGFDPRYEGIGIPFRFASYKADKIEITVGNFYEQFGNGIVLRSYWEWALGVDNSIDGVRVKFRPADGIAITGLVGKQREYWEKSDGIVRGADAEIQLNTLFPGMKTSKTKITLGGSIVSKFQEDQDPFLVLPENVTASSGRFSFRNKGFFFNTEVAYKINDPSKSNTVNNKPSYHHGTAIYASTGYTRKGLGITVSAKRIDNFDFRSERSAVINDLTLSFLPPTTKFHTYRLPTLFPYATQPNGEVGGQIDFIYTIPKNTVLGGKYGTQIYINYSNIHGLDTTLTENGFNYETQGLLGASTALYYEDINVEISKKWSRKFKTILYYIYMRYNRDVVEIGNANAGYGTSRSHFTMLEFLYKPKRKHALRMEFQHNATTDARGNWAMVLAEYSISPHWFFSAFDEWNYGNDNPDMRIHYYNFNVAYAFESHRLAVGYTKQREGLLCVGGICRVVPASNGFTLSISSSF